MSSTMISRRTDEALNRVMRFFSIDEYNRPLFGSAARVAGVDEFSRVFEALADAIANDVRSGMNRRIKERIEIERELSRKAGKK